MERETGTEEWREHLLERVESLSRGDGKERRHPELMDWAAERGVSRELAERSVEIAKEENFDPALGLALVEAGVGVIELEPPTPISEEDTRALTPPEWIGPETEPPAVVVNERRMRNTFRRMRGELERADLVQAFELFLDEPDVGPVRYDLGLP